ncbi:MAG: hypothetical protein PF637_03750 [Spirochaetes bacterium]|jgi:hypothetical protein|nr:hypothetical protein [Spirochaetota bacterium]
MKKIAFVIIFIPFLISAQNEENNCLYSQELSGASSAGKYTEITLTEEHYQSTNNDLSDIRIIDSEGSFCPYIINSTEKNSTRETFIHETKLIDSNTLKKGEATNFYYDFQIISNENSIKVNRFHLNTDGDDFSLQVEIWGRMSKSTWSYITKDSIYSLDNIQKKTIETERHHSYDYYRLLFNKKNAPFLSLELQCDFDIIKTSIKPFQHYVDLDFSIRTDKKKSIIMIANPDRLKIDSLTIDSNTPYKRWYTINTSRSQIGRGYIYSLSFEDDIIENKSISLNDITREEQLKLVIDNQDDAPLSITKITARYLVDKIIFRASGHPPYKLLYGNKTAKPPVYDMRHYKETIKEEQISTATLMERIENSGYVENIQTGKTLFSVIIVITGLVFSGGIILLMIRRQN